MIKVLVFLVCVALCLAMAGIAVSDSGGGNEESAGFDKLLKNHLSSRLLHQTGFWLAQV